MADLPKSLNIAALMRKQLPGDVTMREVRAWTDQHPAIQEVLGNLRTISKHNRIRLRFMMKTHRFPYEGEAPDPMLKKEFDRLVRQKLAWLAIDDGTGGARVKDPEPVHGC